MLTVDILLFIRVLLELNGLTLTVNGDTVTLSGVLLTFGEIQSSESLGIRGFEAISLRVSVIPLNATISPMKDSILLSSVSSVTPERILVKL